MMPDLEEEDYLQLLRSDFPFYLAEVFGLVNPGARFRPNWHLDLIADRLERCRRGEIRRLIITLPPRSLKSICVSVAWSTWILGHEPGASVITVSYANELAHSLAFQSKEVMESALYKTLFPTRLHPKHKAVHHLQTTRGGSRYATTVGGTLTGMGSDVIIIDDPIKPDAAWSDTVRRSTNEWLDMSVPSRLNDKTTGCIVLVMQRLHMDDPAGHLLAKHEGWEVVDLPAIADEPLTYAYETVLGQHRKTMMPGELLHGDREPRAVLEALRASMGEYNFAAQYLQRPVPRGGARLKRHWFGTWSSIPQDIERVVQSWDIASKASESADYSVCTTWGIHKGRYFLLDVVRRRCEFPDLLRAIRNLQALHLAQTVLIEDSSAGTQAVQQLRHEGVGFDVIAIRPDKDKEVRLMAASPAIEAGRVVLPERAPWLDVFLLEILSFPSGKHDDQVDAMSQFLGWAREQENMPMPRIRRL